MRYATGLVAAGLLAMAGTASAGEFSGTVTAVSDYDFRGVSLSAKDPALQGSIDFASDSGFYAGAWASNLDYGPGVDGEIKLDLYLGWAGETAGGLGWDAGIVWYTYPDSSSSQTESKILDYPEIYAAISHGPFEFKQWYTNDYGGGEQDALYSEVNASFELPSGFTLNLHGGYNYGEYFNDNWTEFFDFSAGVGYTVGHFDMELKITGTDLSGSDEIKSDLFNTEPRAVLSVSTTFPWSDE